MVSIFISQYLTMILQIQCMKADRFMVAADEEINRLKCLHFVLFRFMCVCSAVANWNGQKDILCVQTNIQLRSHLIHEHTSVLSHRYSCFIIAQKSAPIHAETKIKTE